MVYLATCWLHPQTLHGLPPFSDAGLRIIKQECLGLKGRAGYHAGELGLANCGVANYRRRLWDLLGVVYGRHGNTSSYISPASLSSPGPSCRVTAVAPPTSWFWAPPPEASVVSLLLQTSPFSSPSSSLRSLLSSAPPPRPPLAPGWLKRSNQNTNPNCLSDCNHQWLLVETTCKANHTHTWWYNMSPHRSIKKFKKIKIISCSISMLFKNVNLYYYYF